MNIISEIVDIITCIGLVVMLIEPLYWFINRKKLKKIRRLFQERWIRSLYSVQKNKIRLNVSLQNTLSSHHEKQKISRYGNRNT